ncbi:MAG: hypothetical protein JW714_01795 [Candidatus Omnitrophica bacterium]|nr:hypothetical protein [Candidatus Omnitrophota bacterium]
MKLGKVILAGIIVGVLNAVWGFLTCGKFFNWVYALEPTFVWKTIEEIPFVLANISGMIFAILLALVYALVHKGLPGTGIIKGLCFGLFVWLVGTLPGVFSLALFSRINQTVIIYWIISGLIVNLWQGLVLAAIYK